MTNPMSWDEYFAQMVLLTASKSEDESTKCGAIIVDKFHAVISTGYNGFPRRIKNTPERQERPLKYKYFEHAERNCIYNASRMGAKTENTKMYVTGVPCADCARGIIQAGIEHVVLLKGVHTKEFEERWKESTDFTLELFKEAHVAVDFFDIAQLKN